MSDTIPVPPEKPSSGFDFAGELQDFGGLAKVLSDKEVKALICQTLKAEIGLPDWATVLFYRTLVFGAGRLQAYSGQVFASRLNAFVDRWPPAAKVLQKIVNLKHGEVSKDQLKTRLIAALREECPADLSDVSYDEASGLELLIPLYMSKGFDRLGNELDEQTEALLTGFQQELDAQFNDFKNWFKTDRGPALHLLKEQEDASIVSGSQRYSLHYTSGINRLVGREKELGWLREFTGAPDEVNQSLMFRWMLLIGPGGLGKTRLAYDFLKEELNVLFWERGFLSEDQLTVFLPRADKWRPRSPFFMVIDYPRNVSSQIGRLIGVLVRMQNEYEFPVRLLLVERAVDQNWVGDLLPGGTEGLLNEKACHKPPMSYKNAALGQHEQGTFTWQLSSLSREAVLKLMKARFAHEGVDPPDDIELFTAASRLDRDGERSGYRSRKAPRPLFAAAAADAFIIHFKEHGNWPKALDQVEVFRDIIKRDRDRRWRPAAGSEEALTRYEYALALATLVGGFNFADLTNKDDLFGLAARWLPEAPPDHLPALCAAMGGAEAFLPKLEPDILGEFFVLEKLRRREFRETEEVLTKFVGGALSIGRFRCALVMFRVLQDFPEGIENLGVLELPKTASISTAVILARLICELTTTEIFQTDLRIFERLETMRASIPEQATEIAVWEIQAAINVTKNVLKSSEADLVQAMLNRLETLRKTFPKEREIAICEARSSLHLITVALCDANFDLVLAMLDRLKVLREAFPEEGEIRVREAQAAVEVTNTAGGKGDLNLVHTMLDHLDILHQTFPKTELIIHEIADSMINITSYAVYANDWDLVLEMLGCLRNLRQKFPESKKVALIEARAAAGSAHSSLITGEKRFATLGLIVLRAFAKEFSEEFILVDADENSVTVGEYIAFLESAQLGVPIK